MSGIDGNTVLMVQSETTDGSTTFTDTGLGAGCPHPITPAGQVRHSTTQAKFGSSSIYWDGVSPYDYLSIPDHTDFEFGSGDFTIDLWAYPLNSTGPRRLVHKNSTGNYTPYMLYANGSTLEFWSSSNGAAWNIQSMSMGSFTSNAWQHYAVTRSGNTFRTFRNGTLISTVTSSHTLWDNSVALWIGAGYSTYQPYYGYMEEIRFSKGVARWTANFTPPTEPYSGDSQTAMEDARLDLSAYYQALTEIVMWLGSTDGVVLADLEMRLQAATLTMDDLATFLSAYYQSLEDVVLALSTSGSVSLDLRSSLSAPGQALADLTSQLRAAGAIHIDFNALLQAASPTILTSILMALQATNGLVTSDVGVLFSTRQQPPSFQSIIGQRLSSVLSEVA
jgi:hypothetical protein